jgi:hypothetical protein
LASAITSGNASIVDYHILEEGCNQKFLDADKRRKQKLKL